MAFQERQKQPMFNGGKDRLQTIRLRVSPKDIEKKKSRITVAFSIGKEILERLSWRHNQRIKLFFGTDADAGKVLIRPINLGEENDAAYKLTPTNAKYPSTVFFSSTFNGDDVRKQFNGSLSFEPEFTMVGDQLILNNVHLTD